MKSDKARKVTSREYMMKLLYQADVNKEEIENLEGILDKFLNDNFEYIANRYEELRLQYSNNPELSLENLEMEDIVDKEYMQKICKCIKENHNKIDELINNHAKNWSISRMPKVDVSILRLAICELLFVEEIPDKVSINEAVEISKLYCDDKTPKFINGILGSIVNEQIRK
ncbi:MAG: transcription antitermination factor NusB [Peptostreptococcaceae bacterium]